MYALHCYPPGLSRAVQNSGGELRASTLTPSVENKGRCSAAQASQVPANRSQQPAEGEPCLDKMLSEFMRNASMQECDGELDTSGKPLPR